MAKCGVEAEAGGDDCWIAVVVNGRWVYLRASMRVQ
jgi:hypothetical protein